MVCETIRLPGRGTAIVCGRRRRRPPCAVQGCTFHSEFQCDAPVGRRTCDRYLCRRHRTPGGAGVDYCPAHAQHARQRAALMADKSAIEWTEASWNPIGGCSVISPGCQRCYAMRLAGGRLRSSPKYRGLTEPSKVGPVWNGDMRLWEKALDQPLRWKKPRRIFVNSMSDLFHEAVPDEWIDRIFAVMAIAQQHTFQVLTKRADRMRRYLEMRRGNNLGLRWAAAAVNVLGLGRRDIGRYPGIPLPNVWLGVSVENQEHDVRIRELLATPAAVRWVSLEPLLGPVDMAMYLEQDPLWRHLALDAPAALDWVVLGGESGMHARPMHPDWARSVASQCRAAGVPFFMKQMMVDGMMRKELEQFPCDLQVREYPNAS